MSSTEKIIRNRQLRVFGTGFALIFGVLSYLSRGMLDFLISLVLFAIALSFATCTLFFPEGLSRIYRLWMVLGEKIGHFNTNLILFFSFYLVILPIGLALKIVSRDPLKPLQKRTATYWSAPVENPRGLQHYKQQY